MPKRKTPSRSPDHQASSVAVCAPLCAGEASAGGKHELLPAIMTTIYYSSQFLSQVVRGHAACQLYIRRASRNLHCILLHHTSLLCFIAKARNKASSSFFTAP